MTNEELDAARAEEAYEQWKTADHAGLMRLGIIAARLAREGWTPTPAIDPIDDRIAYFLKGFCPNDSAFYKDKVATAKAVLVKHNLAIVEIAREQDKAEPVITETRCLDPIGCSRDGYCSCGQDKAEPVAPPAMSRDYRAGIERTIKWYKARIGWAHGHAIAERDLLGGAGDE